MKASKNDTFLVNLLTFTLKRMHMLYIMNDSLLFFIILFLFSITKIRFIRCHQYCVNITSTNQTVLSMCTYININVILTNINVIFLQTNLFSLNFIYFFWTFRGWLNRLLMRPRKVISIRNLQYQNFTLTNLCNNRLTDTKFQIC